MKKTHLAYLLTVILLFLTACALDDDLPSPIIIDPTPDVELTPTPEPLVPDDSAESPDVPVEDDTVPPRDGMVRSLLTNEWVDADVAETRPIAVMIPNESSAVPHYSLSKASVLYEANVEGRMSRMMAIYEDWEGLEKIGNIRSIRTYYMYWAFEWDAFIVHYGGPFFINDLIAEPTTQHIDGNAASDTGAFFRTTDRSAPHNGYAFGKGLMEVIKQKGYSLRYRGLADNRHFLFTSKSAPNDLSQYDTAARDATYIDMSGCYPLTRCYFEYNEEDGLYYRSQHLSGSTDGPHIDETTGEQLTFKNILIQYVKYEDLGNDYMVFQCHDNTRSGWFFTNGKGIHVNWEKSSDYGATRFYDDYGNEVTLNTGKTMICVVKEGETFTFR